MQCICKFSDHLQALTAMDPSVKTTIEQRLVETGEKERLKEHLRLVPDKLFFLFLTKVPLGIG